MSTPFTESPNLTSFGLSVRESSWGGFGLGGGVVGEGDGLGGGVVREGDGLGGGVVREGDGLGGGVVGEGDGLGGVGGLGSGKGFSR